MNALDELVGRKAFCTCGMDDNMHESHCGITERALAQRELAALRARVSDDEQVAEFNAGYEAYQSGVPYEQEPLDTHHDQWRVGWAWAVFEPMRARVAELEREVAEANRQLMTSDVVERIDPGYEQEAEYYLRGNRQT